MTLTALALSIKCDVTAHVTTDVKADVLRPIGTFSRESRGGGTRGEGLEREEEGREEEGRWRESEIEMD